MFTCLMKGLLSAITLRLTRDYRRLSLQLLRIEVAKVYLRGVLLARLAAIGAMGLGLVIGLIVVGALLVHASLFVLLPGSSAAKAMIGLVLGVVYGGVGWLVLRAAMSERTWMDQSGATTRLREALDSDSHR